MGGIIGYLTEEIINLEKRVKLLEIEMQAQNALNKGVSDALNSFIAELREDENVAR